MSAVWRPELIADLVPRGSRVLDIGCADGSLLCNLRARRGVHGFGLELDARAVRTALGRGLAVVQGDADSDLDDYPSAMVDVAILSQTLQATRRPSEVLANLVRIGRQGVVAFTNFGHGSIVSSLVFGGRMPVSDAMPYPWYNTPNIHFFTLSDLTDLCRQLNIVIERRILLDAREREVRGLFLSLRCLHGIFVIRSPG